MFYDMMLLVEEQVCSCFYMCTVFPPAQSCTRCHGCNIMCMSADVTVLSSHFCTQGDLIDQIEHNVSTAAIYVQKGAEETRKAVTYSRSNRRVSFLPLYQNFCMNPNNASITIHALFEMQNTQQVSLLQQYLRYYSAIL